MTRAEILESFQNLNIWKSNGVRAPHKPLLVLYAIGKLLREEDTVVYADAEQDLKYLLEEFGPWRRTYHPEQPFWRLRSDKGEIWEIPNSCKIGEGIRKNGKSTGNPVIGDLRDHGVGGFPKHIANKLRAETELTSEIVQNLLDAHFPFSYYEDILGTVGIGAVLQIHQPCRPVFREDILKAYNYKCAVCGFDVKMRHRPVALEASHIKWYRAGGPDKEVKNALALCSLHQRLFDRGVLTLSTDYEVLISEYANGSVGFEEWLMRFDGKTINKPQRKCDYPCPDYINWHLKEVFKTSARDRL